MAKIKAKKRTLNQLKRDAKDRCKPIPDKLAKDLSLDPATTKCLLNFD